MLSSLSVKLGVAAGVMALVLDGSASERRAPDASDAYRLSPSLTACFCPSTHANTLLSTRDELETMLAGAPCTSRGEGAETRARQWADRCQGLIDAAGIDFGREALFFTHRFFSSGMIRGELAVSGPDQGVLTVTVKRIEPPAGPLTPDLGTFSQVLVVDKAQVKVIKTDDGGGNAVLLRVATLRPRQEPAPSTAP